MQITKNTTSPTSVTLDITLSADDLTPIKDQTLRQLAPGVKVPGFRSGKAPLNVIEKNINQQKFLDEFIDNALNHYYSLALQQEKLRPVSNPTVTIKSFVPFSQLTFDALLEVIGAIKLPDYKAIKVPKKVVTVKEEDVKDVLSNLKKRSATKEPVERAAKINDEAWIDFSGTDEAGKPIAGADGKDYPLLLGSNTFIPGFEDNVVGLKVGDKKTFTLTFPKDYGVPALQSKKVTFTVTLTKVNAVTEPKEDDAFAAQVGPFKNMSELKADIKKQLASERQFEADRDYENDLIKAITAKSTMAIPERLIDEQVERMEQNEKQNLLYRGQTWQDHLASEAQTEIEHRAAKRPEAEERVKAGLVLTEIAEKEGVDVTPQELEQRLAELKLQYTDEKMLAEIDKPDNRRDIAARLMTEKTIATLINRK